MKVSKLRVTGLCEGNSPVAGGFPAQSASNAEIVSICWRHHIQVYQRRNWADDVIAFLFDRCPVDLNMNLNCNYISYLFD